MRAARTVSAAALALVMALTGCGGGGDDETDETSAPPASTATAADQAAITKVAVAVVSTDDKAAPKTCRTMLTANLVKTVFKNQKLCAKSSDEEAEDKATGPAVSGIAVEGAAGEAIVTDQGGSADGATGRWTFVRTGGEWRVDTWSVEYLRSGYARSMELYKADDASDPFHNAQMRECIGSSLTELDDAPFTAGVYENFRQTKKGSRFLIGLLIDCGKTEVSPGVSLLRTVYEEGVRESLLKEKFPASFVDCVVTNLRERVSDAELQKSYEDEIDGKGQDPALTAKYEQAGGECRGAVGA